MEELYIVGWSATLSDVYIALLSDGPLEFDACPHGVFIIPRQLSAIIRQGCFYRNAAKSWGTLKSSGRVYIRGVFGDREKRKGEEGGKENIASVQRAQSRVTLRNATRRILSNG